ncbi:MAG: hypothetical protein HZA50_15190 [Planctomycetes bacterium]|nr:hypothetical protein [Planctomycetota bacterium]
MTRNAKITLAAMCMALLPLALLAPLQSGAEDPVQAGPFGDAPGGRVGSPDKPALPDKPGLPDKPALPGKPGAPGGRGDKSGQGVTEEQERELLEFYKSVKSEYYDSLVRLRDNNPHVYKQMLKRFWNRYQEIKTMPRDIQVVAIFEQELKAGIWKTGNLIREAKTRDDAQAVQQLTDKLRDLISQQFDAEMKMTEYGLTQFEERLKKLREELKQRAGQKDQIIEQRLHENLQDNPATMPAPGKHDGPPRGGEVSPSRFDK